MPNLIKSELVHPQEDQFYDMPRIKSHRPQATPGALYFLDTQILEYRHSESRDVAHCQMVLCRKANVPNAYGYGDSPRTWCKAWRLVANESPLRNHLPEESFARVSTVVVVKFTTNSLVISVY